MAPVRDPKPGGVKSGAEALQRRRLETTDITIKRREETVRRKRLRRATSAASLGPQSEGEGTVVGEEPRLQAEAQEQEQILVLPTPEDIEVQVRNAVEAMNSAPVGSNAHLNAVRGLRELLSSFEEPPYKEALSAGAIPALLKALQPPQMGSAALEGMFEAAWALTNLAVGDTEVVRAVLPLAPVLIPLATGGSGIPVAEQCAWALGNIAGEDIQYRSTLIANGAIRPLAMLFVRGTHVLSLKKTPKKLSSQAKKDEDWNDPEAQSDDPAVSAAATAAWALTNLMREAGEAEIGEFMGTQGAAEALVKAISQISPEVLATEAAWVLADVSAGPEKHLSRLVELRILPALYSRIKTAVESFIGAATVLDNEENVSGGGSGGLAVLTPTLRSLGNFVAGGGDAVLESLLESGEGGNNVLKSVVICAESRRHGLQREAAWVLGNVAGAPGRAGVEAMKRAGALPALMALLKDQPFHVKKEAAFALANVCAGGGGGTGDAETMNYLFGADVDALRCVVSLMRSPDMAAAKLGLQFTEMLLRMLPSCVSMVEACDGIDAIEALRFGESTTIPPELRAAAAALVDRYWGTDMGEEAEGNGEEMAVT